MQSAREDTFLFLITHIFYSRFDIPFAGMYIFLNVLFNYFAPRMSPRECLCFNDSRTHANDWWVLVIFVYTRVDFLPGFKYSPNAHTNTLNVPRQDWTTHQQCQKVEILRIAESLRVCYECVMRVDVCHSNWASVGNFRRFSTLEDAVAVKRMCDATRSRMECVRALRISD